MVGSFHKTLIQFQFFCNPYANLRPYVFSADDEFDERTFPQRTQRSVK